MSYFKTVCFFRCKKHGVPIDKIYNKTQRDKFRWAIDMATEDYHFQNKNVGISRPINNYIIIYQKHVSFYIVIDIIDRNE